MTATVGRGPRAPKRPGGGTGHPPAGGRGIPPRRDSAALGPRYARTAVTAEPASRPTTPPWSGRRDALLDAALAVAVFAGSLALLAARGDSTADTQELDLRGVLLAALASLPLVAWRRAPLA